ncbi:MAG: WG repeat-containing protein [Clostridia bacterium]|nr:WG repeat-containing protein [Clostridia bacterium]
MKKNLRAILCLTLALLMLALCFGCGSEGGSGNESSPAEPEYVEPVFDELGENMTDLAFVGGGLASFKDAATGSIGLINSAGEVIVPAEYSAVKYCEVGYFFVLTKADGSEYTYDPEEKTFTEGNLCAHGGPAVFVWDAANQQVVYYEVDAYPVPEEDLPAEGKAEIIFDLNTRKVGLVGHDGKLITEPVYDEGLPFANGLAAVKKDGRWGYVNERGEEIIGFYYDDAYVGASCGSLGSGMPYDADVNGMVALNHDGLYGIYNGAGDMVCAFQYRDIVCFGDGNYAVLLPDGSWRIGNIGGVSTPI